MKNNEKIIFDVEFLKSRGLTFGGKYLPYSRKEYDLERTKILEGYGLREIRFTNSEIKNYFEKVCKKLENIFTS